MPPEVVGYPWGTRAAACGPPRPTTSVKKAHATSASNRRSRFWETDHPVIGPLTYDGPAYLLSETRAGPRNPAPLLGQHTEQVFRELLGYSEEELVELVVSGALQ